jgi:hypothetical protein
MNPYESPLDNLIEKKVVVKTSIDLQEGLGKSILGILKNWSKDFIHLEFTDPKSPFREGMINFEVIEGIFEPK